jgi:putative transposase
MTGLPGRWPIWDIVYAIRRSAMSCSATVCRPCRSATHLALLAGTDFLTAEVLTLRGLMTYYVLFFIHLESRRVDIAGITIHPNEQWMKQMARNVTMEGCTARSPNLNAYAERRVRSVKEECLSKIILFGERSLRRALTEYVDHNHQERNHQGKDNVLLFPRNRDLDRERCVQCRERLGGLLRYYHQEAA